MYYKIKIMGDEKFMRARIVVSMLVIALAAAMLGGATFAWFTDGADVATTSFTAGTIILGDINEASITLDDMAPGDFETVNFNVVNAGTLDMFYRVYIKDVTGELHEALTVEINSADAVGLDTLTGVDNPIIGRTRLDSNDEAHEVSIKFILPTTTGNSFQGKTFSGTLVVEATQVNNNEDNTDWTVHN